MTGKLHSARLDDTTSGLHGTLQSLPDAVPDSRPGRIAARWLGATVAAAIRLRYRVETQDLKAISATPGTLLLVTHRRDADVPIIGNLIARAPAMKRAGKVPHFVAREDLFHRGLLWEYTERWPRFIREMLSTINLHPVMRLLHAHPMRRIPERSVREVLKDTLATCGDLPLEQVLKPAWAERFTRLAPPHAAPLTVARALTRRYDTLLRAPHGFRKLTRARFSALKLYERTIIAAHLQRFIELIERGTIVLLEPEGAVSPDGRFGRLRTGLHTLLNRPRIETRMQPIGISYDFMTPGRTPVFVAVGPELPGAGNRGRRATCERAAAALLAQSTVTATHLGSRLLLARAGGVLSAAELEDFLARGAAHCAATGLRIDSRLLDAVALAARTRAFIDYCVHCALLVPCGGDRFSVSDEGSGRRRCRADPHHALAHAGNELAEIVAAHPGLSERIAR